MNGLVFDEGNAASADVIFAAIFVVVVVTTVVVVVDDGCGSLKIAK